MRGVLLDREVEAEAAGGPAPSDGAAATGSAGPIGAGPRAGRRRIGRVVVAAVLLAVLAVEARALVVRSAAGEDRKAAAVAQDGRVAQEQARAGLARDLADLDAQARTVDADLAAATADLAGLDAALAAATARQAALAAEVAELGPRSQAAAAEARAVATRVGDLRACVAATNQAVNHAALARPDAARGALAAGRGACDRARAAT